MPEMQVGSSSLPGGARPSDDILARIVATKWEEIRRLTDRAAELKDRARDAPEPRDFQGALELPKTVSLIAEVKRRSPGAGAIRPDLDPVSLAARYREAGASALSVLTDWEYFGGSLDDLAAVRAGVGLPVLRKDFLLVEDQVWEARAAGADAILLIVRILEDAPLRELRLLAEELGMAALVEVHDADELERALRSGVRILGINNRNLRTFETRLETTLGLLESVPKSVTLVSESGIRRSADVSRLGDAGVDAVLVGEALLRAPDPKVKAKELAGIGRVPRTGTEAGGREVERP